MKLTSKKIIIGEEEEDLQQKYLNLLRDIRDNDNSLFEKIKRLPKKARTSNALLRNRRHCHDADHREHSQNQS